jgi:NADPH-dependent curcumin reductase CurA
VIAAPSRPAVVVSALDRGANHRRRLGSRGIAAPRFLARNLAGRVILSGLIDQYNDDVAPPAPSSEVIIAQRLTVQGLRVFDAVDLMPRYERLVAERVASGDLVYAEDIRDGLEEAPASLARVLTGGNFSKSLVRISP